MSKISNCTNISSLSKTLRFKLIPVGKTKETFEKNQVLLEDEKRSDEYSKAKWLMDKYYREFIETALCEIETDSNKLNNIEDYYKLYRSDNKSEDEKKKMSLMESAYRKQIAKSFSASPDYNKLFGADIIRELMSKVVESEEDKKIVHSFSKFTTYFTGFLLIERICFRKKLNLLPSLIVV